ncbi:GMC oxidoreductase [Granulicella arctica]|uniref:Choline dehydrogenase-like flavoprotein n=1 Tax=Granulicella arctica TaxID=940613 RepID=A0A7Y9TL99_9BACT|nr:GMC family oxidoreductase [Granulicella arctica]NYF79917.1 choline dehydrogenase-like flavoprotein [Granulicella arctica]
MPAQSPLQTDVCVIGAGPAGLTIATELAQTRHSVLVLESGGERRENDFAAGLNEIESVGAPREMDTRKVRNRVLGGTSHTWSGRCTPLDAIDYEPRSWVSCSGWPISEEEMEPFIRRAEGYLGLVPLEYDEGLLKELGLPARFDTQHERELRSIFWQFSRISALNDDFVRFGPRFRKLRSETVSLVYHATVTQLLMDESGGRIHEVEVATPDRTAYRVRARYVVLCGGGIENARILLASNQQERHGVGNRNDLVGRFLMDHPRATLGTFPRETHGEIQKEFGLFRHSSGAVLQRGLSLSPTIQRERGLLNCAAWTTQHVDTDDVWRALRSIGRNNGGDRAALSRVVVKHADQILKGLWTKFIRSGSLPRRMGRLDLDAMVEQMPASSSRVMLSDRVDALGMPIARIDWRIGELERLTAIHLGHAVNEALARACKPQAILADWVQDRRTEDAVFYDPAHPIGSTRMSDNEHTGVVDRDSKVHRMENLYIAGSSVFPTGGHANPTLMIVAMALRVADRLKLPEAWGLRQRSRAEAAMQEAWVAKEPVQLRSRVPQGR